MDFVCGDGTNSIATIIDIFDSADAPQASCSEHPDLGAGAIRCRIPSSDPESLEQLETVASFFLYAGCSGATMESVVARANFLPATSVPCRHFVSDAYHAAGVSVYVPQDNDEEDPFVEDFVCNPASALITSSSCGVQVDCNWLNSLYCTIPAVSSIQRSIPSNALLAMPTAAPAIAPTRAPVIAPTRAPVVVPTPVFVQTEAPIITPVVAPTNPRTSNPPVLQPVSQSAPNLSMDDRASSINEADSSSAEGGMGNNIGLLALIGIAMLCVTVIIGLYIRNRKSNGQNDAGVASTEPTGPFDLNSQPNSTNNNISGQSAMGELMGDGGGRMSTVIDSQTTPPFAQVVNEDSSEKVLSGFLDFKHQVRSVDPSEERITPTPSASTPAVAVAVHDVDQVVA